MSTFRSGSSLTGLISGRSIAGSRLATSAARALCAVAHRGTAGLSVYVYIEYLAARAYRLRYRDCEGCLVALLSRRGQFKTARCWGREYPFTLRVRFSSCIAGLACRAGIRGICAFFHLVFRVCSVDSYPNILAAIIDKGNGTIARSKAEVAVSVIAPSDCT